MPVLWKNVPTPAASPQPEILLAASVSERQKAGVAKGQAGAGSGLPREPAFGTETLGCS